MQSGSVVSHSGSAVIHTEIAVIHERSAADFDCGLCSEGGFLVSLRESSSILEGSAVCRERSLRVMDGFLCVADQGRESPIGRGVSPPVWPSLLSADLQVLGVHSSAAGAPRRIALWVSYPATESKPIDTGAWFRRDVPARFTTPTAGLHRRDVSESALGDPRSWERDGASNSLQGIKAVPTFSIWMSRVSRNRRGWLRFRAVRRRWLRRRGSPIRRRPDVVGLRRVS